MKVICRGSVGECVRVYVAQVMCVQYWPAMVGCSDHYEGIKVDLLKEEQLANFMIRTIKLSLEENVSYPFVPYFSFLSNHVRKVMVL